MKREFKIAKLSFEFLEYPETEKGEVHPFSKTDETIKPEDPMGKSGSVEIPEEILNDLILFLEDKGVFMGHMRGVAGINYKPSDGNSIMGSRQHFAQNIR